MGIKSLDIKKLYGRSAGRCNFCTRCFWFKEDVHIGQMAHVIAESPKGPQFDF